MSKTSLVLILSLLVGCATPDREGRSADIRDLQSLDFQTWDAAARRLVLEGSAAVPALNALAEHDDAAIQERAVYVLGEIGPPASSAQELLLRKLDSEYDLVRLRAVESLRLVASSEAAASALKQRIDLAFLSKEPPGNRIERIRDLVRLLPCAGPASLPILLDLLESPEKEVRECAGQELREISYRPLELLPRIIGLLRTQETAHAALLLLPGYGASAKDGVPQLIEWLKDDDLTFAAASALWSVAPEKIPALFDRPDAQAFHLSSVLNQISGHGAGVATPTLIRLLGDADVEIRDAAARALGDIRAAEALPALQHLFDGVPTSRVIVAEALGRMGPKASSTVPTLVKALGDPNMTATFTKTALEALAQIGGDSELLDRVFVQGLGHPDHEVRHAALHGLWTLKSGRADVEKLLQDGHQGVRQEAKRVLARIDGQERDRDGLRFDWFTTDEELRNGRAFDRGTMSVPEGAGLIVPDRTEIVIVPSSLRTLLFMEKVLSYAGHDRIQPQTVRETMGCAWKQEGRTIRIATFGEWGSIEGGTALHLRVEVPKGIDVRTDRSLDGERSPANRTLTNRKGRPAASWSKIDTVPDEESAQGARRVDDRWEVLDKIPSGIFWDIFFLDAKTGWLAGSEGCIASTTDGGRTWTPLKGAGSGTDWWNGVRFLDAQRGVLVGGLDMEGGAPARVVATQDGGATWKDLTPGFVKNRQASFYGIQFVSETEGFIYGKQLLATKDAGKTWTTVGGRNPFVYGLQMFATPKVGWTLEPKDVLKTEDGGITWKSTSAVLALTDDERTYGGFLQLHFRDELHGWVWTYWNHILRTEDGGLGWKVLEGPRPGHLRHTLLLDDTHGWAILERGSVWVVLRTDDGGRTWTESYQSKRRLTRLFFLGTELGWVIGDNIVVRLAPAR